MHTRLILNTCRCCTVNFPQGYPKFVTNSFVKTPDNSSLVQVYLGPFNTKTVLFGGMCRSWRYFVYAYRFYRNCIGLNRHLISLRRHADHNDYFRSWLYLLCPSPQLGFEGYHCNQRRGSFCFGSYQWTAGCSSQVRIYHSCSGTTVWDYGWWVNCSTTWSVKVLINFTRISPRKFCCHSSWSSALCFRYPQESGHFGYQWTTTPCHRPRVRRRWNVAICHRHINSVVQQQPTFFRIPSVAYLWCRKPTCYDYSISMPHQLGARWRHFCRLTSCEP